MAAACLSAISGTRPTPDAGPGATSTAVVKVQRSFTPSDRSADHWPLQSLAPNPCGAVTNFPSLRAFVLSVS